MILGGALLLLLSATSSLAQTLMKTSINTAWKFNKGGTLQAASPAHSRSPGSKLPGKLKAPGHEA